MCLGACAFPSRFQPIPPLLAQFVAILLPNAAFATLGLEHCVANTFLGALAMAAGATSVTPVDWLLRNLVPATLGNLAGGLLMAMPGAGPQAVAVAGLLLALTDAAPRRTLRLQVEYEF